MPITGAPDPLITLQATLAGAHQGASTLSLPERSRAGPTTSLPAGPPFAAGLIPEDPARQCLPCSFT